jgi:hypothetical protein
MAKGQGGESTKEIHKPGHGDAKAGHDDAKKAEPKKVEAPASSKTKGHSPLPGGCHAWGCKAQANRFNFCNEHYDHFKFGLIKKTGEPVSDYEKKIEHYLAHKKRPGVHKVA